MKKLLMLTAVILLMSGCARQQREESSVETDIETCETCTECHEVIAPTEEIPHEPHTHKHASTEPAPTEPADTTDAHQADNSLKKGKKLHEMLSPHELTKKIKNNANIRKDFKDKVFFFKLKAPFHSTVRGFTPMILIGLVDENGHAVSQYGKYLQIGENAPMTIHAYKPGPYYINYITSNILSVFKRPIDFRKSPDKELLEKTAGHPVLGLGPIYLAPGEESAEYTFEVGINTPKKSPNGGVYTYNGIHIVFDGAAIY